MNCYVISLQRAWERREHISHEFEKVNLPFEFFDAVDGTRLNDETLASVDRETRRKEDHAAPGQLRTGLPAQSHVSVP